jgi:hypothetical protein
MKGLGERLYFEIRGEMNRAITSAPPPAPAGTMNSMGLVGCQAFPVPIDKKNITKKKNKVTLIPKDFFFIIEPPSSSLDVLKRFNKNVLSEWEQIG